MSYSDNLPDGLTPAHPHWNPPVCPECGAECAAGEDCPECGEYVRTEQEAREDAADAAADAAYDRMVEDRMWGGEDR